MIGNDILLDTNVIVDMFRGDNSVADRLNSFDKVYVPSIVLGELYLGAHRSASPAKHLNQIGKLMKAFELISVGLITAEYYGKIKAQLLSKGKPIPKNDIWIAAVALQHQMTLISTDGHFDEVENLYRESWR